MAYFNGNKILFGLRQTQTLTTVVENVVEGTAIGATITLDDVSPVGHEMGVQIASKNLIPYPYADTTVTKFGLTLTDNGDGTITANGTVETGYVAIFNLVKSAAPITLPAGKYVLSGCPVGGGNSTYQIRIYVDGTRLGSDNGNGFAFTLTEPKAVYITFAVGVSGTGYTVNNLVCKPMLELGDTATEYVPFAADFSDVTLVTGDGEGTQTTYAVNADGSVNGVRSIAPNMALWTEQEGHGVIEDNETLENLYFNTCINIDDYLASLTYQTSGSYAGSCQLIANSSYSTILIATDLGLSTGGGINGYTLSIAHLSSGTVKGITTVYSTTTFNLSSYYSGYKADKIGWQMDSIDFAMTVYDIASAFSPINGTVIKDRSHGVIMNLKYHQDANIVIARLKEQLKAVAVTIPLEDESEV